MSITSFVFILFVFATLILYYLIPKKYQWCILLIASVGFYLLSSIKGFVFVLITASSVYGATVLMQKLSDNQKKHIKENKETLTKEQKAEFKAKIKNKRKTVFLITLFLNLGLLCFFKYFHFVFVQFNSVLSLLGQSGYEDTFSFIVPLGISFYTFQSTGYLINVYWENYKAEKNPLKVLLFVSFFPQITQGPISEYEQLSTELFKEHNFTYKNYSWGFQRMLWGFLKKMVVANTLSPWVQDVFENYSEYTGLTCLIGAFMYSVQIYADFSGYMDIMCGYCEMLDIKLTENFERPYFSKSIAEYWRRWHISLGAWFKNYIYYPIAISKWNRKLGKNLTYKFGKSIGKNLSATIALIAVWLTTGLWHGASWAYIAWGGVNGLFIIFSMWMEPVYDKTKKLLHINEKSFLWKLFITGRTFILVTFIKVLPEVGTLKQGLGLWKRIFTDFTIPYGFSELLPFSDDRYSILNYFFGNFKGNLIIATGWTIILLIVSLIQRKTDIRAFLLKMPKTIRWMIFTVIALFIIFTTLLSNQVAGFMYENY